VIRRRPVAVYRVIDEEELLGEPAPSAHVVDPGPERRRARRLPRGPLALACAAATAAVAVLVVTGAPAALPREHAARPAPAPYASAPAVHRRLTTLPPRPLSRHRRRPPARRRPDRPEVVERAQRAVAVPPAPPDPAAEFGFER
jgi:hypothetical protein